MAQDKSRKAREQARLADELRANLAKRKAQSRSRRIGEADGRDEGIDAAPGIAPSAPAREGSDEPG